MMSTPRPLVLALGLGLLALVSAADADAQKKKSKAPAVSAQCSDFYAQANAGWLKANPLPAGAGAVSALGQLSELALQQQRQLLDAAMASPQNDVQARLGDFWASGLDEAAVEADGSRPIATLLSRIDAIKKAKDVPATIAALHQVGIPVAFNFAPDVDLKALDRHIGYFMQGGMGLPDPAFYTRTDADTVALMGRYRAYVKQILALTGTPSTMASRESAMSSWSSAFSSPWSWPMSCRRPEPSGLSTSARIGARSSPLAFQWATAFWVSRAAISPTASAMLR